MASGLILSVRLFHEPLRIMISESGTGDVRTTASTAPDRACLILSTSGGTVRTIHRAEDAALRASTWARRYRRRRAAVPGRLRAPASGMPVVEQVEETGYAQGRLRRRRTLASPLCAVRSVASPPSRVARLAPKAPVSGSQASESAEPLPWAAGVSRARRRI